MKTNYLVLDGNHALHRTLRLDSFNTMYNQKGDLTGGVLGVIKILKNVIDKFKPDKCIYVWDGSLSKRRLDFYPEYKGQRIKSDDTEEQEYRKLFYDQCNKLAKLLPELGVHSVRINDKEGDDVCYWITNYFEGNKVLVSSDKDYVMMIAEDTSLYRPIIGQYITHENCKSLLGFSQYEYLFYKVVKGDGSDNIPGVHGIGDGTIRKILDKLNCPEVSNSLSESLYTIMDALLRVKLTGRENKLKGSIYLIERNRKLMDFAEEEFSSEDCEYLKENIHNNISLNRNFVINRFKEYAYIDILSSIDSWLETFERLN